MILLAHGQRRGRPCAGPRAGASPAPTDHAPTLALLRRLRLTFEHLVDLGALVAELAGLLRHTLGGVVADLLADLHGAEFRSAHRAEMRQLGALGRQGLVVELLRRLGVEREVELVAPAELEPRPAERIVAQACGRMPL